MQTNRKKRKEKLKFFSLFSCQCLTYAVYCISGGFCLKLSDFFTTY